LSELKIYLTETGWELNNYEFRILVDMLKEYHATVGELSRKYAKGN